MAKYKLSISTRNKTIFFNKNNAEECFFSIVSTLQV